MQISSIHYLQCLFVLMQCRSLLTSIFSPDWHFQRSISFRTEARPLPPMPIRTRQKASSFPRRRSSQLWSDTVDNASQDLSAREIKRQEVRQGCFCGLAPHSTQPGPITSKYGPSAVKARLGPWDCKSYLSGVPLTFRSLSVMKQEVSWLRGHVLFFGCHQATVPPQQTQQWALAAVHRFLKGL